MPSCSRTRRVAGPMAAQDGAPSSVKMRSAALRIARAPFALVIYHPAVGVQEARGGVEVAARWLELDGDRRNLDGIEAHVAQRRHELARLVGSSRDEHAAIGRQAPACTAGGARSRSNASTDVELEGELAGEILAGPDRTVTAGDRGPGAVRAGVAPEQVELVADDGGQRADRGPAASSGCAEERPLGLDRQASAPIVDGCGHREHPLVVGPDLDRDRTLPRGRRHDLGLESLGDPVSEPHPVQSRAREHERVGLTRIEPAQSRVDVAVEWMDDEIRPPGEQEARPPRAVGPDATTRRQVGEPSLLRVGRTTRASRGSARGR